MLVARVGRLLGTLGWVVFRPRAWQSGVLLGTNQARFHDCRRDAVLTRSIPCDTPLSPREELATSMGGMFADLDFSGLSDEYASKQGIFDPERAAERAEMVRKWLRERPEREIVCECVREVLAATIARWLRGCSSGWANGSWE